MPRTPTAAETIRCLCDIADLIQKSVSNATNTAVNDMPRMSEIVLINHTWMRNDVLAHLGRPKGRPIHEMPGTTAERLRVVLPEVAALLREVANNLAANPGRNPAATNLLRKVSGHFRHIVVCHRLNEVGLMCERESA